MGGWSMQGRKQRGFTLIELLTTVSVIAILGLVAVPSFRALRLNSERTVIVNAFFHALFYARSESIKRGKIVSLCRSVDGERCATNSARWTDGWIVFVNVDRDDPAERDPEELLLGVYEGWAGGEIISNRLTYSFRPQAQAVVNGTILFCDPRGPTDSRAIIISHTGRPRVSNRDSAGRALDCPQVT